MDRQTKTNPRNPMKIGRLAALSGINRSSIHHYLNLGLLPKPDTAGLNIHFYNRTHLAMLREIKRLRDEEKMSLAEIREWMAQQDWTDLDKWPGGTTAESPEPPDSSSEIRKTQDLKRDQIIETATDLFSRSGHENVRISDITDALRMSKATFYEYFQGKEQLFVECIKRLAVVIVPREMWHAFREERDYFERQKLRAREFLKSFPGYSGILQQARIFSKVGNPELAAKAKETFQLMAGPLKKDIEYAQNNGMIRSFDPEIGSHMLLGLAEGIGWKLITDPDLDLDQVISPLLDLIRFGLSPGRAPGETGRPDTACSARILDVQGIETTVNEPRFNGRDYLEGRIGEALVKVVLNNVTSLGVAQVKDEGLELSVLASRDQAMTVRVDRDIEVSGSTTFGEVRIPLEKVARIMALNNP